MQWRGLRAAFVMTACLRHFHKCLPSEAVIRAQPSDTLQVAGGTEDVGAAWFGL